MTTITTVMVMTMGGEEIQEKYETEEVEVYEEGRKWESESESKREIPVLRVDPTLILSDVDTDTL